MMLGWWTPVRLKDVQPGDLFRMTGLAKETAGGFGLVAMADEEISYELWQSTNDIADLTDPEIKGDDYVITVAEAARIMRAAQNGNDALDGLSAAMENGSAMPYQGVA